MPILRDENSGELVDWSVDKVLEWVNDPQCHSEDFRPYDVSDWEEGLREFGNGMVLVPELNSIYCPFCSSDNIHANGCNYCGSTWDNKYVNVRDAFNRVDIVLEKAHKNAKSDIERDLIAWLCNQLSMHDILEKVNKIH